MSNASIVPIIGGGPAGMSCALWLHNCALRPIIIERETALGGMARRSPYLNEGLLGRARGKRERERRRIRAPHSPRLDRSLDRRSTPPAPARRPWAFPAGRGVLRYGFVALRDPLVIRRCNRDRHGNHVSRRGLAGQGRECTWTGEGRARACRRPVGRRTRLGFRIARRRRGRRR